MYLIDRIALFTALDAISELKGSGVGYIDPLRSQVLRYSTHSTGMTTFVILEEDPIPQVDTRPPGAEATERESHLWSELSSMGISCSGAVLTGMAVAGYSSAVPFSAGTSTALVVLEDAAARAGTAECGTSIEHVISEIVDPGSNDVLNSKEWVYWAKDALDVITTLGGSPSTRLSTIHSGLTSHLSGRNFQSIIHEMNRITRRRLARELRQWTRGQSRLGDLARQGQFPSIYGRKTITMALQQELYSAVASAMSLNSNSALSRIIVHVIQDQ